MNILLVVLLAVFGLGAGGFIGMGNHSGLAGAILPGLIVGLLVAIPSIRERSWPSVAVLVFCALVGSFVATTFADNSPLKRFCREQSNLVVHIGSFRLGAESQSK